MASATKVLKFALVSGIGLFVDLVIFFILIGQGATPFTANLVSGACAVTFVYFCSVKRVFSYQGKFLLALFLAYVVYQICGVTAASLAVDWLSRQVVRPEAAKFLILPVTFTANYLFMALLTARGGRRPATAALAPRNGSS